MRARYAATSRIPGSEPLFWRRYRERQFGLLARLAVFSAVLAAEYLATVIWPFGHAGYRLKASVATYAAIFFTFAYLKSDAALRRISSEVTDCAISLALVFAHFCAVAVYGVVWWAQGEHVLGLLTGYGTPLRWISGAAGVALAAFAFIPYPFWLRLVRETGWLWFYSLIASAAAFVAVDYLQPLWSVGIFEQGTFTLVKAFLTPLVPTVVADPAARTLGTPRFSVVISSACSGVEGVGLMLAFVSVWLWLFRRECRLPQALLLFPAGAVGAFLLNSVRIAAIILIGTAGAPAIAMGGFHTAAGWCLFCAAALGFSISAHKMRWLTNTQPDVSTIGRGSSENPTAVYLLPFCGILAAGILGTLAKSDFDWLYPLRFLVAASVLWILRKKYSALDWKFGWSGPAIGVLTFFLWIGVDRLMATGDKDAMPDALASASPLVRTGWIVVRVLAAVLTVPIAEELAFRGFLMRRLISSDFESVPLNKFTWLSLGASSILFGLLHGNLWFAGVVAGLLYSWAMVRRGRFGDAVMAHATTNALLAAYVVMFQRWHLW